jgi:hypothetical protein
MSAAKLTGDRLVLGLPYYGALSENIINTTEVSYGQEILGESSKPYYNEIAPYLSDPAWTRYWNDLAQCPYLLQKDDSGNITGWLAYDDPESLAIKINYAKEKGLSGLMCWTLNGDDDDHTLAKETAKYISDEALTVTPGKVLPYTEPAATTAPAATDAPAETGDEPTADATTAPEATTAPDDKGGSNVVPIIVCVAAVLIIGAAAAAIILGKKKK